ncbi:DUF6924 domain-containing protein [Streptomyces sp. NRRL F-5126]|uniref:DUF6924 domain-containing protein n=1 Tax=Streptomyces sp. NRRL F-5126 TaxID=1463857 RepID=UPI00068BD3E0|nr:hypothetical protein [Streptomyces sp. NRRL F-5126]
MPPLPDESDVFRFELRRSAPGHGEWAPAPPLTVHVGEAGARPLARLSWATADGTRYAMAFAPGMAQCVGHRRAADGGVTELRGELADSGPCSAYGDAAGPRAYAFDVEEGGQGTLHLWIDDGGTAPLCSAEWSDASGDSRSLALCSATASGTPDVTHLVGEVLATAQHVRAGEVAGNLIDPSRSKWFAPHDRVTIDFRLTEPVAVERYLLTSANDAADRDPSAWTLNGSADGGSWSVLDSRSGVSFTERHQSKEFRIAAPGAYDHYRLDITRSSGSPHLQLSSVRFLAAAGARFVGHRGHAGGPPVVYRGTRTAPPGRRTALSGTAGAGMVVHGHDGMYPFVVRTDFGDDGAWARVITGLREPIEEDDEVEPWIIEDRGYEGAPVETLLQDLRAAAPAPLDIPGVIFVADGPTMREARHPLLAVRTETYDEAAEYGAAGPEDADEPIMSFRIAPDAAVELSVNLGLGNMDFEDFAGEGVTERMN